MNTITLSKITHKGVQRIKLEFAYNKELVEKVKQIPGCRWSKTMRCWHISCDFSDLEEIRKLLFTNLPMVPETNNNKNTLQSAAKILAEVTINKSEQLIYIKIPYNKLIIPKIKRLPGAWWHAGAKVWSVHNAEDNLRAIKDLFKDEEYPVIFIESDYSVKVKKVFKAPASRDKIPSKYLEQLMLENKSSRTIEIYMGFVAQLIKDFNRTNIEDITEEELRFYILQHREKGDYSESYQNQMINAFKSYFRIMFKREFDPITLPRPKQGRYLPKILPREDIERIFLVCHNEKHRMVLMLLYGFGLRISELLNLEVSHIQFERRQLAVIAGKGKKDRILPIPKPMVEEFRKYIKSYLPVKYLIVGQKGERYSVKSAQNIIKKLAQKADIKQTVTPHMIRHCYATHMLERGTDLRYIQGLLGHSSSRTTEIYTHVSMHKLTDLGSPLDDIKF